MLAGVDLRTPPSAGVVQHRQIVRFGQHQIGLRVANQVLDDALRLRVSRMAEVRSEPVVGREPDVVRRRDHHPGNDAALQAAHPIGQDLRGDTAQGVEAIGEHRQRRRRRLIPGDTDEPHTRPGEHRGEHLQPARQQTPVDHQRLARHPHRRPPLMTTDLATDLPLHPGHEPPEVAVRPRIAGRACRRQQPLRRAATVRFADQIEHDRADPIGVLRHRRPLGAFIIQLAGLVGEHLSFHRLRIHAAHLGGGAIRPKTRVRVNSIHVLPR